MGIIPETPAAPQVAGGELLDLLAARDLLNHAFAAARLDTPPIDVAVERLRAFVAADPAEFTHASNQSRERRILDALVAAPGEMLISAAMRAATIAAAPLLTVEDVIESQRLVAEILAERRDLVSEGVS